MAKGVEKDGMLTWGSSHIGLVREVNEDSYVIRFQEGRGFLAVADGMGGHQAGEVASAMAIDLLTSHLEEGLYANPATDRNWLTFLREGFEKCNSIIYQESLRVPEYAGMGTTITAALVVERQMYYAHVGDSRLYLFRQGKLELLSRDHSLVQGLVDEGLVSPEEAMFHPRRHILTRAVGTEEQILVDTDSLTLQDGDLYLLCTDGLSNSVSASEIEEILSRPVSLAVQGQTLLDLANARGGEDNVTLILARVTPQSQQELKE